MKAIGNHLRPPPGGGERQVTQLIEDDGVHVDELFGEVTFPALLLFPIQLIDYIERLEHVIGQKGLLVENLWPDVTGNNKPIVLLPFIGNLLGDLVINGIQGFFLEQVLKRLLKDVVSALDDHLGLLIGRGENLPITIRRFTPRDD